MMGRNAWRLTFDPLRAKFAAGKPNYGRMRVHTGSSQRPIQGEDFFPTNLPDPFRGGLRVTTTTAGKLLFPHIADGGGFTTEALPG